MSDVLERIYKARIWLLRRGVEPSAVYIGNNEYNALRAAVSGGGAITVPMLTLDNRTRVFNMPVFVVDADDHLQVV